MNFVALALLEASSGDDENAFWILVGMCDYLDLEVRAPSQRAAVNAQRVRGEARAAVDLGVDKNG